MKIASRIDNNPIPICFLAALILSLLAKPKAVYSHSGQQLSDKLLVGPTQIKG
jgi:hypothetical protein